MRRAVEAVANTLAVVGVVVALPGLALVWAANAVYQYRRPNSPWR